MQYYITYGNFQQQMKDFYLRTGSRMQFPEMIDYLYTKGLLTDTKPVHPSFDETLRYRTDPEFNQLLDSMIMTVALYQAHTDKVREIDIFPNARDVFIIRHPRYTRPSLHTHNYFEINFVAKGTCTFSFENTNKELHEGELCIIAPSSKHDLTIIDESTVFTIMLRKSTFDTTFFSLMSQNNLLSYFFRTILQDSSRANYLLFYTDQNDFMKSMIQNALMECHRDDDYSNTCCISWIHLLFSNLLRNYSKTVQFYDYQMGADFSLILQYIQHNYQTLTLASLAKFFHYSEPHLSTLIKQNTGYNFTELIKRLRMADAIEYLIHTNLTIQEISEKIGYHSADHFSRVFRSVYQVSPQKYRKIHVVDTKKSTT